MPKPIIRLTGQDKIASLLDHLRQNVAPTAVAQGLYLEANNIMAASKKLVPVDLGALKTSGYVTLPQRDAAGALVVELGYGGPAADYAVVQHERLDYRHLDGGEAKYLEKPLDQRRPRIAENVAAFARAAIERGIAIGTIRLGAAPTDPWSAAAAEALGKALKSFGKSAGFAAPRKRRKKQ